MVITHIDTTIIKAERILRYDIKIKNTGNTPFKSEFDYPGQHNYGIEVVVRPNKELASKMELVEGSEFIKMIPWGSGSTGLIDSGHEGSFHVEYKIKKGAHLKEMKELAFDSTLIILDGVNVVKEFPLDKVDMD
ncbi:hypothetical protein RCG19_14110 [Neobacillus sp. OS1-2]|uniref:hypothetical protein n=1 Tax=Neobacillus sp. OS1-2 TaxID=3070680 RepID=UPI0027E0BBB3|nr:hypothetical protein [Neobacillus sp. OS1-2]WML38352.1 hypothetical protein RCG19_14110 [Neobacillus sp. OS1-2]